MSVSAADIATVLLAVFAALGIIAALVRWFFNRGADEREFTLALKQNTAATKELTGHFNSFRSMVSDELHDHDLRITRLEATPHGGYSPDRDARTAG